MTKPKRIQRKRTKGWRMPERTLCVSRPGVWGNPYSIKEFGGLSLPLFRNTVKGIWDPSLFDGKPDALLTSAYRQHRAFVSKFARHPLDVLRDILPAYDYVACWCKETAACHGDILLELAFA
jgi:hypothetical protein